MKATKRRFEQFLFYDSLGIEKHLEKMALKGWRLDKITPFGWKYRKSEPQRATYAVTYFSEASEFNPYPTENQQTFYGYCENAGWTLAAQWGQMQIFCTEQENLAPIETDESVKLKAIHRAMKKNFLPSSVLLLVLFLFQIIFQFYLITKNPVDELSNSATLFMVATWIIIAVQMLIPLIGYAIWYLNSQKAVSMGEACADSGADYQNVSRFMWFLGALAIVLAVFSLVSQQLGWGVILGIANVAGLTILVITIKNALKRAKASRRVNLTITMISCAILSLVLTGAMTWGIVQGVNAGLFRNRKPVEKQTITMRNGATYTREVYHDVLPLTVEDLQNVDYEHYSYEWTAKESFLLAQYTARQNALPDGQSIPELSYSMVDVKWLNLFDISLNDYLEMYNYHWDEPEEEKRYFRQTDDPMWQADAVYQLHYQGEAMGEYILCWGSRIVHVDFGETPTAGQVAVTVKKLKQ